MPFFQLVRKTEDNSIKVGNDFALQLSLGLNYRSTSPQFPGKGESRRNEGACVFFSFLFEVQVMCVKM